MDGTPERGDWEERRAAMVTRQLQPRGIRDAEVLAALASVPRERFVPPRDSARAYDDGALGIGDGQTISQPYIVARMTQALELAAWRGAHPDRLPRVLDVGTGSGYQAAVLATLGAEVISIEWNPALASAAQARLRELDLEVEVVVGDGSEGYPQRAPYAGIIVAAAAPSVPPPLQDQLKDGGRLVLPVGQRELQELTVVERRADQFLATPIESCVFVPLLGRHGFPEEGLERL